MTTLTYNFQLLNNHNHMATKQQPKSGIGLIASERADQIFVHGYTFESDSKYYSRDVFQKAAIAILHCNRKEWPESTIPMSVYDKTMTKDKIGQVATAGAFLAAEIDYIKYHQLWGQLTDSRRVTQQVNAVVRATAVLDTMTDEIVAIQDTLNDDSIPMPDDQMFSLCVGALMSQKTKGICTPVWWCNQPWKLEATISSVAPSTGNDPTSKRGIPPELDWRNNVSQMPQAPFTNAAGTFNQTDFRNRVMGNKEAVYTGEEWRWKQNTASDTITLPDNAALLAWQKQQGELSTTTLKVPTEFLRSVGLIEGAETLRVITKKRDTGTEHINLAQLLSDYLQDGVKEGDEISIRFLQQNRDEWQAKASMLSEAYDNTVLESKEWERKYLDMEAAHVTLCRATATSEDCPAIRKDRDMWKTRYNELKGELDNRDAICALDGDGFDAVYDKVDALSGGPVMGTNFYIFINDVKKQLIAYKNLHIAHKELHRKYTAIKVSGNILDMLQGWNEQHPLFTTQVMDTLWKAYIAFNDKRNKKTEFEYFIKYVVTRVDGIRNSPKAHYVETLDALWDDYETSKGKYINFFDFLTKEKYLVLANNCHTQGMIDKQMRDITTQTHIVWLQELWDKFEKNAKGLQSFAEFIFDEKLLPAGRTTPIPYTEALKSELKKLFDAWHNDDDFEESFMKWLQAHNYLPQPKPPVKRRP